MRLMEPGLADRSAAAGAEVTTRGLGKVAEEGEVGRSFEVKRGVTWAVADAVEARRFPVVLAGNCNASLGAFAGLGSPDAEMVRFDGHADLCTPDDLTSGYFDSMLGWCRGAPPKTGASRRSGPARGPRSGPDGAHPGEPGAQRRGVGRQRRWVVAP